MRFRHSFRLPVSQTTAAGFHSQASRLAATTPPLMPMRLQYAQEPMADSDETAFTMWLGPIPVSWVARVQDVTASGFADRQQAGPLETWIHCHTFLKESEGTTIIVDEIEAELKRHPVWGPVGLAMWLGLPLLVVYRGWSVRRMLVAHQPDTGSED